uniref:Uncharacterized protein n=1 Tax=Calcidiscus leptoporus TaxID=127549 RepID=A0A7S0J4E7_9EUKA
MQPRAVHKSCIDEAGSNCLVGEKETNHNSARRPFRERRGSFGHKEPAVLVSLRPNSGFLFPAEIAVGVGGRRQWLLREKAIRASFEAGASCTQTKNWWAASPSDAIPKHCD